MIRIEELSWNSPLEEQAAAMRAMCPLTDEDAALLILPFRRKDCWENCAKLLAGLDDRRFLALLPRILAWYQDLNWPGIGVIRERIGRLPARQVEEAAAAAMRQAETEHDEIWLENLATLFVGRDGKEARP